MKLIKCIITTITFAFAAQQLVAGGHGDGHPILTPLEPKAMEGAYTAMLMGEDAFKANSGFDEKTYQLVALAASAGMKCEYCIVAHTALAKAAGASDEEIKSEKKLKVDDTTEYLHIVLTSGQDQCSRASLSDVLKLLTKMK